MNKQYSAMKESSVLRSYKRSLKSTHVNVNAAQHTAKHSQFRSHDCLREDKLTDRHLAVSLGGWVGECRDGSQARVSEQVQRCWPHSSVQHPDHNSEGMLCSLVPATGHQLEVSGQPWSQSLLLQPPECWGWLQVGTSHPFKSLDLTCFQNQGFLLKKKKKKCKHCSQHPETTPKGQEAPSRVRPAAPLQPLMLPHHRQQMVF